MMSLTRFASLLGIPSHQAEDALHSERAARHVLSRRSFFGISAAMAAGTAFGFAKPAEPVCVALGQSYSWANIKIMLNGTVLLADTVSITFDGRTASHFLPREWRRDAGTATYSAALALEETS